MQLRYRRVIYLLFIGFFLVSAPILILYTTGYKYNFKNNRIEKTGVLYVDSDPKDADILINKKFKNKTPARFSKMLPDIYEVEVGKQGFHSWEKSVEIKSNLSTFHQDIVLFKNNLPINLVAGEINILAVSPNRQRMVYSVVQENTETLRLLNLNNNSDFVIGEFNNQTYNQLKFVEWSASQNKALLQKVVGDFNQFVVIDVEDLKIKELFDITRLNFSLLKWDEASDAKLYGLRRAVLHQIDLTDNTVTSLLTDNINDFIVRGDEIYYISTIISESFLNKVTVEGRVIKEELAQKIKLPSPSNFSLQPSRPDLIALLDGDNRDLFILKGNAFSEQNVSNNIILQDRAKKIVWSKNFDKILLYTDFEIAIFDIASQQKNLVTRYGNVIDQVMWHPKEKYLIFQIGNSIQAIEAVSDEIKNETKLLELPQISAIAIDQKAENIYFKSQAGNTLGLYKLEIR